MAFDFTADLTESLRRMGLAEPDETPAFAPLSGGVSSDIWRVVLRRGPVCLKRALPKLRVETDWFAPVERGGYEIAWFRVAGGIVPQAVPKILGADPARQVFAMEFLDPRLYRLWKTELRDGHADPAGAAAVGRVLAAIHAATADRPEIAAAFPTDAIFRAIRLEPYLEAAAARHPDLAGPLDALVATTLATRRALVHGDVSPKNILIGPAGPVLLDAECAWFGDPAFDLAFCLNHLLLKCLWTPGAAAAFLRGFDALAGAYLAGVAWEAPGEFEIRAASLLPGLFLARIDGKSPVEYVTAPADKDRVRRVARALLLRPVASLAAIRHAWTRELGLA